jgi:PAS domain S-box-containing protein
MKFEKLPLERRVESYYPKYRKYAELGQRPPFFDRLFRPYTIAGCRIHDRCMGETAIERQVLVNMREIAFKLKITHGGQGPNFTVDWASPGYNKVLGYDLDAAIGADILQNVHPEDLPELMKFINERLASKDGGVATFRSRKADGTYIYMEGTGTPLFDGKGNVDGAVIVCRDVSERIVMEKKFREIFEHSPIAIEVFNPNGDVLDYNPACGALFGVCSIADLKEFNLFHDKNITDERKELLKQGIAVNYEAEFDFSKVPYPSTVRGTKNLHVVINPVKEMNGIGFVVQVVDITDAVRLTNELLALNADKDMFFKIITHDLRNPFNSLLGFSKMLRDEYHGLSEEDRILFTTVLAKSAQSAFDLLMHLTNWRNLNGGKLDVAPSNIGVREIADVSISECEAAAGKKHIAIINNISDLQVFAQEPMLKIIFSNLLTNAIKFTPAGGNGTITVSAWKTDDGYVKISVSDNGMGMPEDTRSRLFPAKSTDGANGEEGTGIGLGMIKSTKGTNGEEGTGIGLGMVKTMAEKMGGAVSVESEVGKGTTFTVTLPAAQG